jgi:hypothetical protein
MTGRHGEPAGRRATGRDTRDADGPPAEAAGRLLAGRAGHTTGAAAKLEDYLHTRPASALRPGHPAVLDNRAGRGRAGAPPATGAAGV